MKKMKYVCWLAIVGWLCSCGGSSGSGPAENAVLGKAPGYFKQVGERKLELEEARKSREDKDRYRERLAEFDRFAAECYAKAAEEGPKATGHAVPFSGDVYPDLYVTDVVVEGYEAGTESGNFILRVKVAPKRDIVVRGSQRECAPGEYSLNDTRLYFALLTSDDHLIDLGELNPFNYNFYNMRTLVADFQPGDVVAADTPCHQDGAPVALSCHVRDYSDFGKIHFLTESDYMNMRRQRYGF